MRLCPCSNVKLICIQRGYKMPCNTMAGIHSIHPRNGLPSHLPVWSHAKSLSFRSTSLLTLTAASKLSPPSVRLSSFASQIPGPVLSICLALPDISLMWPSVASDAAVAPISGFFCSLDRPGARGVDRTGAKTLSAA